MDIGDILTYLLLGGFFAELPVFPRLPAIAVGLAPVWGKKHTVLLDMCCGW
jgi:hypothetical protein